ncbi:MAG TPA: F0F1 ATP synthase subunit delta [Luteimonas sp.]|nr:F0F1 ATP synthase subunit delta [Luteimonas sp.]
MSQSLKLARPYARAMFALARDEGPDGSNTIASWSQALVFSAQVAADPRVASLLGNPKLTDADAVTLLLPDGATAAFGRFLAVLAENRRLALLPEIAGLYEELRADAERVVKAKVTSATALPASELDTITAALKKRFGREVEVETAVDESLIGGAVIDAGDVVIDGSLRGKLARLQAALAN